jgi:hypothetical protein
LICLNYYEISTFFISLNYYSSFYLSYHNLKHFVDLHNLINVVVIYTFEYSWDVDNEKKKNVVSLFVDKSFIKIIFDDYNVLWSNEMDRIRNALNNSLISNNYIYSVSCIIDWRCSDNYSLLFHSVCLDYLRVCNICLSHNYYDFKEVLNIFYSRLQLFVKLYSLLYLKALVFIDILFNGLPIFISISASKVVLKYSVDY